MSFTSHATPRTFPEEAGWGKAATTPLPNSETGLSPPARADSPVCPSRPAVVRGDAGKPLANGAVAGCAARRSPAARAWWLPSAIEAARWAAQRPCTARRCGDALRHKLAEIHLDAATGNSWEKFETPTVLLTESGCDDPLDADALSRCGLPESSCARGIHVSWLGAYD